MPDPKGQCRGAACLARGETRRLSFEAGWDRREWGGEAGKSEDGDGWLGDVGGSLRAREASVAISSSLQDPSAALGVLRITWEAQSSVYSRQSTVALRCTRVL